MLNCFLIKETVSKGDSPNSTRKKTCFPGWHVIITRLNKIVITFLIWAYALSAAEQLKPCN